MLIFLLFYQGEVLKTADTLGERVNVCCTFITFIYGQTFPNSGIDWEKEEKTTHWGMYLYGSAWLQLLQDSLSL